MRTLLPYACAPEQIHVGEGSVYKRLSCFLPHPIAFACISYTRKHDCKRDRSLETRPICLLQRTLPLLHDRHESTAKRSTEGDSACAPRLWRERPSFHPPGRAQRQRPSEPVLEFPPSAALTDAAQTSPFLATTTAAPPSLQHSLPPCLPPHTLARIHYFALASHCAISLRSFRGRGYITFAAPPRSWHRRIFEELHARPPPTLAAFPRNRLCWLGLRRGVLLTACAIAATTHARTFHLAEQKVADG